MTETLTFDPDGLSLKDSNIFGLPYTVDEAKLVFLPVPWEVTVSYRAGTAGGPEAIFQASRQVDLYDADLPESWKIGFAMDEIPAHLLDMNRKYRERAKAYIEFLEDGGLIEDDSSMQKTLQEIDAACQQMNQWVQERSRALLDSGKLVGLIGGDHSTPLGLLRELAQRHESFGILHIDAHADLRDAYEGFTYSHASIMFNALELKPITKLVQVGIRDYCHSEADLVTGSSGRIVSFYDRDLKRRLYEGDRFIDICDEIIDQLPESVYLSFDIDGLDPRFCPNTGTPVPGGLEAEQVLYLVKRVVDSGRKLIAFDLNEVAPGEDEWDANVASRILYRLAGLTALSNSR